MLMVQIAEQALIQITGMAKLRVKTEVGAERSRQGWSCIGVSE